MSIKEFILANIKLLDNDSISIEELLAKLCQKYQEETGKEITDDIKSELTSYLTRYKNKEINSDDVIGYLEAKIEEVKASGTVDEPSQEETPSENTPSETTPETQTENQDTQTENSLDTETQGSQEETPSETQTDEQSTTTDTETDTSTPTTGGYSYKKTEILDTVNTIEDEVVDIESDIVMEASEQYASVESTVESTTIEIPASITPYASSIISTVNESKVENTEALNSTKETLITIYESIEAIDNHITSDTGKVFDFNDIWAMAYNKKTGSKLKAAGLDFFRQNKDCQINGSVVTFTQNGKTYKYNLANKTLTVNGESVKVGFFVPSGTKDYSKLNTFTYFIQDGYDNPTAYPSDAVDVEVKRGDNKYFVKQKMVAESTKFMNGVAKTDLNNCQNIIGGDSLYGAESLKLAATNGNLYKSVYCVNNAVLVTGKNASRGNKVQFDSLSQLKGLDGKNVYFISAQGDENFNHCAKNGGGWVSCSYDEGYVFTGLDLVAKNCPNANIYLVYSKNGKSQIKNHYASLDKKYKNVHYLSDKWYSFAKKDYTTHSDGNRIMPELVSALVTNYNGYSV